MNNLMKKTPMLNLIRRWLQRIITDLRRIIRDVDEGGDRG